MLKNGPHKTSGDSNVTDQRDTATARRLTQVDRSTENEILFTAACGSLVDACFIGEHFSSGNFIPLLA